MITPLNIVSLNQGKETARGEDEYYQSAPEWRKLKALARFLARLGQEAPEQDGAPSVRMTRSEI